MLLLLLLWIPRKSLQWECNRLAPVMPRGDTITPRAEVVDEEARPAHSDAVKAPVENHGERARVCDATLSLQRERDFL